METPQKVINEIKKESKNLAFSTLSKNLARIGYGARGLIYGTIGVLAIMLAFGASGSLKDSEGAIAFIGKQPLGLILLGVILIGLIGYSLWGLIRAFFDPLHHGKNIKGVFYRVGYFISAIGYGILILPTYNFIFGMSNAAQNGAQGVQLENIIGTIFLIPLGKWIVGLIGMIVLGIGAFQVFKGVRYNFDQEIKTYSLTSKQMKIVKIFGRVGTVGRAVVALIIGLFFLFAAYHADPSEVKGINQALLILLNQPYGNWLLAIVAFGFISFGCYSILSAFWFKFKK
jgi:hypothetical protein